MDHTLEDNRMSAISFTDAETHRCPFTAYDQLRKEAPVYLDPGTGHYVLTRYVDVRGAILNHKALSSAVGLVGIRESSAAEQVEAMYAADGWPQRRQFQSMDPPEHREKRSLIDKAFAHWNVSKIESIIEALAEEIIAEFADDGQVEFVNRFAARLTIAVISQQLGVERAGHDLTTHVRQLQTWSDLAIEVIDPLLTPERHIEITRELIRMQHFYAANIERVKAAPDDTLLSQFIQNILLEDGMPDIPEILELMKTVLVTGNETTRFAMASGMKLLIDDPELCQRLATNLDEIPSFVEEALRLLSPVQTLFRRANQDMVLHGIHIPKGARVEVRFGAANRDPATFECPNEVRLDRPKSPAHLAFGAGIHSCIGMQLARTELVIAFRTLLGRLMNFRLARGEDSYQYNAGYLSHGLTRLDIAFDQRARSGVR
jgi:cytochrome P450